MPPKSPPPDSGPTIPCEQCGYANEPERVYCHNCGAKLDRSLLPKAAAKKQDAPEKVRKRVKKMTNPGSGGVWREIKALFKVAFFSALLATAILFFLKPEDLPEIKKSDEIRLVSSDMMEAMGSPTPRPVKFSDNDINQYFAKTLKPKDTVVPGVQMVHAYAACSPGVLHLFEEFSIFGMSTYSRVDFKLEVKDGKFTPTIIGGAFGRLSIDPQVMPYTDYAFGTLWASLEKEHKEMDKFLSVTVQDGHIDLVSKGAGTAR